MLAKVIASAETREAAIARLAGALREYPILGVRTNIPFLIRILEHPQFRAGDVDTGFLDREGAAIAEETWAMPAFLREALASLHESAGESGSAGLAAHEPIPGSVCKVGGRDLRASPPAFTASSTRAGTKSSTSRVRTTIDGYSGMDRSTAVISAISGRTAAAETARRSHRADKGRHPSSIAAPMPARVIKIVASTGARSGGETRCSSSKR